MKIEIRMQVSQRAIQIITENTKGKGGIQRGHRGGMQGIIFVVIPQCALCIPQKNLCDSVINEILFTLKIPHKV